MNQITLCPYCRSSHTRFQYRETKAIYRVDSNGYPVSLPLDNIDHYYCNNCQKNFTIKGTDETKITVPSYNVKDGEVTVNAVKTETPIDEKLDKIIKLLEKLIAKL